MNALECLLVLGVIVFATVVIIKTDDDSSLP